MSVAIGARLRRLAVCAAALLLAACAAPGTGDRALRLIGEQRIAAGSRYQDTVVGGLSSLDFDPVGGAWIAASDDRGEWGAPRFYTLRLEIDEKGLHGVAVTGLHRLPVQGAEVPDVEAIRFDPRAPGIWYASEGSRTLGQDPVVRRVARGGAAQGALPLPAAFGVSAANEQGTRNNLSAEALAFSPDGASLWLGMEGPLYQDGAPADLRHGAPVRISRFDRDGVLLAQYAYTLEPIPAAPAPGRLADNGVAEILCVSDQRLLVLERSGAQGADGAFRYQIRLFEADVGSATDIRSIPSLAAASYVAARKRLLLDLNAAVGTPGNLEGMAWGPRLASGKRTLVLVSDNNFAPGLPTQFFAFEFTPAPGSP